MTKRQIVRWYLDTGGTEQAILKTVSCYSPKDTRYCKMCPSCFRKYIALRANGIDIQFSNLDLAYDYYRRCKGGEYDEVRTKDTLCVLEKDFRFYRQSKKGGAR